MTRGDAWGSGAALIWGLGQLLSAPPVHSEGSTLLPLLAPALSSIKKALVYTLPLTYPHSRQHNYTTQALCNSVPSSGALPTGTQLGMTRTGCLQLCIVQRRKGFLRTL